MMAGNKDSARAAKLAAALKDNLKRRKAQAKARGAADESGGPASGSRLSRPEVGKAPHHEGLGTAPQTGLEDQPQKGPNAAKKGS